MDIIPIVVRLNPKLKIRNLDSILPFTDGIKGAKLILFTPRQVKDYIAIFGQKPDPKGFTLAIDGVPVIPSKDGKVLWKI